MDLKLTGKRALVTGSSSGIGAEIARMLAAEDVRVVVHGRDQARAKAVADDIVAKGGVAAVVVGDLMTPDGLAAVIKDAEQAFGGIDILVNNAGGSDPTNASGWLETTGDEWTDAAVDRPGYKNVEQGAATTIWCAVSPQLDDKGGVYCADCDISALLPNDSADLVGVRQWAVDLNAATALWGLTERLIDVHWPK